MQRGREEDHRNRSGAGTGASTRNGHFAGKRLLPWAGSTPNRSMQHSKKGEEVCARWTQKSRFHGQTTVSSQQQQSERRKVHGKCCYTLLQGNFDGLGGAEPGLLHDHPQRWRGINQQRLARAERGEAANKAVHSCQNTCNTSVAKSQHGYAA